MAHPLILLVNDNHVLMRQAQLVLHDEGFRTVLWTANDDPMEIIKSHEPAAVVVDIWHNEDPGAGWRLIEQLRSDPVSKKMPIVITTDERESVSRAQDLALGRIAVLKKPYDWDVLVQELRRLLAQPPGTAAEADSATTGGK